MDGKRSEDNMSKCDSCSQNANHKYIYFKRTGGFADVKADLKQYLNKPKFSESQCKFVARYSLNGDEAIVECCREVGIKISDLDIYNFNQIVVGTAQEARDHIAANIEKWEEPQELL
jgi:hypothetical protein